MSITIKLLFDQRRLLKKTGKYPFKLRVTFDRKTLEYQTTYSLSKEDHAKLKAPRLGDSLKEIKEKLDALTAAARTFTDHMGKFSFYEFERDFINLCPGFKKRKRFEQPPLAEISDFDFTPYQSRFKSIFQEVHPSKDYISYVYEYYIRKLIQQQSLFTRILTEIFTLCPRLK